MRQEPSCFIGEPQEVCTLQAPCNWDNITCSATQLLKRACPIRSGPSLEKSPLWPLMVTLEDCVLVSVAASTLIIGPFIIARYNSSFPSRKVTKLESEQLPLRLSWFYACIIVTALWVALAVRAPVAVWGGCEQRGVCVYHSMFCEYTRHSVAVRHPANSWSNLPYMWNALYLCIQALADLRTKTRRSFALLDGLFGVVSLVHRWCSCPPEIRPSASTCHAMTISAQRECVVWLLGRGMPPTAPNSISSTWG